MEAFDTWLAEAENHRRVTGRPLVTLSFAQSLDGIISALRGRPTQISGPAAQQMTHRLRALHQCILVGVGTVLADNPRLTVRLVSGENPQPLILDSQLHTPADAYLVSVHPKPAWIATVSPHDPDRRSSLEQAGARLITLPPDPDGRVDLYSLLDCLGELGVNSLMVEGGAQVITSFLACSLVDQVVITIAPLFLGGLKSVEDGATKPAGTGLIDAPVKLIDPGFAQYGEDLVWWGKLKG